MSDLVAGYQEVVWSQEEKIGLPNWSFFSIMVSIKGAVPFADVDALWDFYAALGGAFILERAEEVSRQLAVYHGPVGGLQMLDLDAKQALCGPASLVVSTLTYAQKETIGLPEKSSIANLGSSNAMATASTEYEMFKYLAASVASKMFEKREAIKMNPRPWIQAS